MTNFRGDAVKLEAEIILNRFRCAVQLMPLLAHSDADGDANAEDEGGGVKRPCAISRKEDAPKIYAGNDSIQERESDNHLSDLAEQQEERAEEHGASRDDRQKRELQEIERGIAEALESQCA
jgi:hypothetical protein